MVGTKLLRRHTLVLRQALPRVGPTPGLRKLRYMTSQSMARKFDARNISVDAEFPALPIESTTLNTPPAAESGEVKQESEDDRIEVLR